MAIVTTNVSSRPIVRLWPVRLGAVLLRHRMGCALLLSVAGWSLMWAQALALVRFVPEWLCIVWFFAGIGLIPFCGPAAPPP